MREHKKEFQKIKSIKQLLESPGYKLYQEKIQEKLEYHNGQINVICSNYVKADILDNLNFHLSCKNMLTQILGIEKELLEDIENSSEDADVKEESEVFVENN